MGNDQSANSYNLKISKYEKWANSLKRSIILEEFVKLEKIKPEPKKRDSRGEINVLRRTALKKAYIEKSKWLTEEQIDEELKEIKADLKDPELDKGIQNLLRETQKELLRHKKLYAKIKAAPPSPDPRAQREKINEINYLKCKIRGLEHELTQAHNNTPKYTEITQQLEHLRSQLPRRPLNDPVLSDQESDAYTQECLIDEEYYEEALELKKKIEYLHREHKRLLQQLKQRPDVDISDLAEVYRKQLEGARAAFKALEQQKDNESQLLYKSTLRF